MTRLFSLIALLGCLMQAVAQPYFPCTPRLDNPYGVCTHITRPGWDYEIRDNELDIARNAGIGWVRSDLDFGNFFTSYTTANPDLFRNVLNSTDHYGTNLLGILTRMGKQSWDDPQYARLVEMMAKTYDGRITHWEAQNEVNLIRGVDDLCRKYVDVLKTTYETLKKVNPKNVVLTSGFGELHEPFLSNFSRLGGWKYCDVFNFHTYFTPEGLIPCFERLKETMNRDGWERPVWLTECGMHTANDRQNSAGFLSDLLPAALRRIGKEPRKTAVGVLRDAESGYNVLTDDDTDYLLRPHFRRVAFISLQQIQGLSVKDVPVLVAAADEYFPGTRFPALLDYVRRGGTIVLAGGMPFYYDAHTPDGIFLEQLEKNPARFLPAQAPAMSPAVDIDLDEGMDKVREILTKYPIKTRLNLKGTLIVARDIAHARIKQMLDEGKPMPEYFKNHPVYYAGPAKTPAGYASGSFGPTTAGRMDPYVDLFQKHGGSMVMVAKGNRSKAVTDACHDNGGFYLGSIGGPAAILAKNSIKSVEVVDFPELGMEAVRKIYVENFPAFIIVDDKGNDFFADFAH